MDAYDHGTALYTIAVSLCVTSARLEVNPALSRTYDMFGAVIGTMLSSPQNIRATAHDVRAVTDEVTQAKDSVTKLVANVKDWEQMSRPEVEAAVKLFTEEVGKTGEVYNELANSLDQVAKVSFVVAVAAVTLAKILLVVTIIRSYPTLLSLASRAATTVTISRVLKSLAKLLGKLLVVYGSAAGLAWVAGTLLRAFTDMGVPQPLSGDKAPDFEQVVIPDLPKPKPA
jgi:hypothetical protein